MRPFIWLTLGSAGGKASAPPSTEISSFHAPRGRHAARTAGVWPARVRTVAAIAAIAMPVGMGLPVAAHAVTAPVGQGFTVSPADLAFILQQIKIAEAHVANTTSETGPCGALIGTGPNQLPSPLVSQGLRTVDGSCNNLVPG